MNYFDLIVALVLVITAVGGFRSGLLQSIFKTAGYIAGGVIGLGFRKVLIIAPLKFIDSLLGGVLSVVRTSFIAYLIAVILIATPWSIGSKYITPSKFYTYADSHLPKVITDLKTQADKLFKELN